MRSGHGPSFNKSDLCFAKVSKIFFDDDCQEMDEGDSSKCSTADSQNFKSEYIKNEIIDKNFQEQIEAFYANFEDLEDFSSDNEASGCSSASDSEDTENETDQEVAQKRNLDIVKKLEAYKKCNVPAPGIKNPNFV